MEISQIIQAIFGSGTNTIAAIFISIGTLLALYGSFKSSNAKIKHYAKQSPAILATVGIFFSFWGISIGLIEFDPKNMEESVPHLLDGLKIKFIASLMGIFASIIVRVAQSFSIQEEQAEINVDDKIVNLLSDIHQVLAKNANNSPEELLQGLKQSIDELPAEFRKQSELLDSIKSSLAGDGDGSVTTQLLKVRTAITDKLDSMDSNNKRRSESLNDALNSNFANLTQKFEDFAKIVAENNSKAFIEALEAAMRDFNNNITEQFGENFKQLNQAVGELLKWQENYREHVEQMTSKFDVALKSVVEIQTAFGEIQTRSENFTQISSELHNVLEKLDVQLQSFDAYLKGIRLIADEAKEAFPTIEDNLSKLTAGFKKSTEQSLADINNTVETVGENLVETTTRLKDTTGKLRDSMEGQRETLEKTSDEFKEVVSTTLKTLAKDTKASIDNYSESLQEAVTSQLSAIDSNIKQSNSMVNSTIQNASDTFEKSIAETGAILKNSTDKVSHHLTDATDSMKGMITEQQTTLSSTSNEFKSVVSQTLTDLSRETQSSIRIYQDSLQEAVSSQLTAIDNSIQKSSDVVNTSIDNVSRKLETTIDQTASTLEESTKKVATHLIDATNSMKTIIESQKETLASTGNEFKNVVNQTLRDLSKETQDSIKNYQESLQEVVKRQLNSIDDSIKETHSVVNKSIQNVGAEFEKAIKNQADSMNKTIATASDSFKTVIQDTAKEFETMAETIAESVELQERTLTDVSDGVKKSVDKVLAELTEQSKLTIKEHERNLHELTIHQFTAVNQSIKDASERFNALLKENTEKSTNVLVQQTQLLDAALQEELKKAIETMQTFSCAFKSICPRLSSINR